MTPPKRPTPDETTEGCRFCWMCRQACPVGHVTARETYTPHAWALTIESVKRGQLSWSPETTGVLYACADCGLCQAHCATDRPLPDAVTTARASVVAQGLAGTTVAELDRRLRSHGNPYQDTSTAPARRSGRVALFVGDAGLFLASHEVDAAVRLLAAAGIEIVRVGEGRSSGLLASSLGCRDTAIQLANGLLHEIAASGATTVLVAGPGDRWTFEHVYPSRLGVAWPVGVTIREVADVLAEAHKAGRLALRQQDAGPFSYVDPCHTARMGGVRAAPRVLMAAAFGGENARELFWREGRAHPCGSVGAVQFTHPDISAKLTDARLADARQAGASWVATDDPACLHHLTVRAGAGVHVRGLFGALVDRL